MIETRLEIRRVLGAVLGVALLAGGCVTGFEREPSRYSQTRIRLEEANFETTRVHVTGEATRHYIFFIGYKGPPDTNSAAWAAMRKAANIEEKAARFVNVTEERTHRSLFAPFYYKKVYTVSADVIEFTGPSTRYGPAGAAEADR
jgi:hypothetical protein